MQRPRFAHPNYNQRQPQWRPGMPRFGAKWPIVHRNRPINHHSKEQGNFTSNNEEHWCETCDRGFHTIQLLENHKQQHQKCNIDGCQFIAHPKVITKHIQMQHSTGLFKKISKLDNPEEIKKWREERKKKYPTKENIEKKTAEIKEKINRGEKMALKHNRDNKFHRTEQGTKRKYSNENNHRQKIKRRFGTNESTQVNKSKTPVVVNKKPLPQTIKKIVPSEDDKRSLKPFTGILHLLDDTEDNDESEEPQNCDSIEDDEYTVEECIQVNNSAPSEPLVCGALSSLICSYECSDDEQETEEQITNTEVKHNNPTETCNTPIHTENQDKPQNSICTLTIISKSDDDDSGPEETKVVKETDIVSTADVPNSNKACPNTEKPKRAEKRTIQDNRHNRNNLKKFKPKLPSTLLEKLLQNEIRQERNIILQCIRYVVNNNYFEKTNDM
ncbi:FMR1-interacting protein NUFIP1 [Epargyreus clarus]|uniref:FMR1-interacting protein NUFIP1 n=1 Tax=Epargyreus clarus TaxID=520877 RepID=UPI003C305774